MYFIAAAVTLFAFAGSSLSAAAPTSPPPDIPIFVSTVPDDPFPSPAATPRTRANTVSPLTIGKYDGETSGAYIVQLKQGADRAGLLSQVKQANGEVTHDDWKICDGFAGNFQQPALDIIRASPDVESITEDGFATIAGIQKHAPWGLARVSDTLTDKDPNSDKHIYYYPDDNAGAGVDIYVLDTGIRTSHKTFQGRAHWGATFGKGFKDVDDNGHGTHVAGVAAGWQYGIAKKADVFAVKVLGSDGRGQIADIISGLNWVLGAASGSHRPSVVNLSFIAGAHKDLDNAVGKLTAAGVHVVVPAGNSHRDASNLSPARVGSAVTVASSNIKDEKDSESNYGSVVKIFAPGRIITSAWNTDNNAVKKMSGTSFAAPHVAGTIAYLIAAEGNLRPMDMIDKLQEYAKKNVLKGVPKGTPNYLVQNWREQAA